MSLTRTVTISVLLIFLVPTLLSNLFLPEDIISPASAASCSSSNREPLWDVEAANITIQDYFQEPYYDEDGRGKGGMPESQGNQLSSDYYYQDPALGTLTQNDDFSTSQVMANDSISGLRLNLTTGQKYTFCITAQHLHNGTIIGNSNVDTYLLTEYDWEIYENDYLSRYDDWRNWKQDIPIEWQSYMSNFYWKPYRDVHEYTDNSNFEFSVALDQRLVTSNMWDENSDNWEEFYLIIDGWDNIYDDAGAPGHEVQVDIQVMIEERYALPNWTVSLTCCGLFLVIAAIPAVLHVRYQKAGLNNESSHLIPKVSGTDSNTFGTMKEEIE